MKNFIIILSLLCFCQVASTQQFTWNISPSYAKAIEQSVLAEAKTIKDINPGYPSSWIHNHISVELKSTNSGAIKRARGNDDILNKDQKNILLDATTGTEIEFAIKYIPKNALSQTKEINFSYTIVPTMEAEFPGGEIPLKAYFDELFIDRIPSEKLSLVEMLDIIFTIDKEGKATGIQLISSSNDEELDKFILDTISNMPVWKPAQDSKGNMVGSKFRFMAGTNMGC